MKVFECKFDTKLMTEPHFIGINVVTLKTIIRKNWQLLAVAPKWMKTPHLKSILVCNSSILSTSHASQEHRAQASKMPHCPNNTITNHLT